MERAALDGLQSKLEEQVKEHFPDSGLQRVALLQYGDDPQIEPGDLWVQVFFKVAGVPPDREGSQARTLVLTAWQDARQAMLNELQREFAQALPAARMLEFKFIVDDNTELEGSVRRRIGGSAADLAERQRDLTPVMARLGPVDLWTLDTLITAGIAANRAEALRWVLARIRERPAYAKLSERARELDELKAQF
ncbi:MAG: hypothetical protein WAK82_11090 [Streptosporangiaceae bacterium]